MTLTGSFSAPVILTVSYMAAPCANIASSFFQLICETTKYSPGPTLSKLNLPDDSVFVWRVYLMYSGSDAMLGTERAGIDLPAP